MRILTVPHKLLYRQATPVEMFGPHIQALIDKMFITMYQHKGIGLAANQIGVLKQIIVLNIRYSPMVLINPFITEVVGEETTNESCLSLPGLTFSKKRATWLYLLAQNRHGKEIGLSATGLLARVIQHEVDHLRGVLIDEK